MNEKVVIKLADHLDNKWQDWFEGMEITYNENTTILTGTMKDNSHLHGILVRIRDLNLKLISVNPYTANK